MNDVVSTAAPVTGVEHWTRKGDVRLFLWEKFVGTPDGKPAVLFVHGSSMASQPTFDLTVPGRPDSSVMDWFARRGFVCWCVDMEGYGRSDKTRDPPSRGTKHDGRIDHQERKPRVEHDFVPQRTSPGRDRRPPERGGIE